MELATGPEAEEWHRNPTGFEFAVRQQSPKALSDWCDTERTDWCVIYCDLVDDDRVWHLRVVFRSQLDQLRAMMAFS